MWCLAPISLEVALAGIVEQLQNDIVSNEIQIGTLLLRLRLLAAKLGSAELEEWIKHEAEGYPADAALPDYRKFQMSFMGSFSGPFGSGLRNVPIPPYLVEKIAGEKWIVHSMRYSAAALEELASRPDGISLDLSNLMLLLRGKVYEDMEPLEIRGHISRANLVEATNAVRNRLLEVLIEIERRIPEATGLKLNEIERKPEIVTQIYNQTIHGDATNIHSSGNEAKITVSNQKGSMQAMQDTLASIGLPERDVRELSTIIQEEGPGCDEQPLHRRAREWLADRITKGVDKGVSGGASSLVRVAERAALAYFGQG